MAKKLGELLIEAGLISNDQLMDALSFHRAWGHRLGVALVAKGFITEDVLVRVLGTKLGLPIVDLDHMSIASDVLARIPVALVEKFEVVPIALEVRSGRSDLIVAMADPLNIDAIQEIEFSTGHSVRPVIAKNSALATAISRYYQRGTSTIAAPMDATAERMTIIHQGGSEMQVGGDGEPLTSERRNPLEHMPTITQSRPPVAQSAQSSGQLPAEVLALLRILMRKGLVTREEFLQELDAVRKK